MCDITLRALGNLFYTTQTQRQNVFTGHALGEKINSTIKKPKHKITPSHFTVFSL